MHVSTSTRSRLALRAALVVGVAAVVAYFALGMPGMDHSTGSSMAGMDHSTGSAMAGMEMSKGAVRRRVTADEFAMEIQRSDTVVLNVHTPYEGEIPGTDLFLPFDAIDNARLPQDKSTTLAVYCQTGRMSAQAATTLAELGYTSIVELEGGMQAWTASGRTLADA